MRVFIVGAGEVGIHIAQSLIREGHDLVLIERDSKKVAYLQSKMDVLAVYGDGCNPRTLRRHGAGDAEAEVLSVLGRADGGQHERLHGRRGHIGCNVYVGVEVRLTRGREKQKGR